MTSMSIEVLLYCQAVDLASVDADENKVSRDRFVVSE
jgi:hypothetical protein